MEKQIKNRFEKVEGRVDKIEKFIEGSLSRKGKLIKCHKCNHSWICTSKKRFVSCTDCGTKTRNIGSEELVKCFKCKKYLIKSQAKFGYNHYFHKKCFKEFNKDAKGKVDKMIGKAEKEGKI